MKTIEKEKFLVFGLPCMIIECTNSSPGHEASWFNGYVGVHEGHPWFKRANTTIKAKVHGGITYTGHRNPAAMSQKDPCWWVGFNTSHESDLKLFGGIPKHIGFVKEQLTNLATQAHELSEKEASDGSKST